MASKVIRQKIQGFLTKRGYRLLKIEDDRFLYDAYEQEQHKAIMFNVGAGLFYHPRWTNIDYSSKHYSANQSNHFRHCDLINDQNLPIEHETAAAIYSSHTVEHITEAASERFFINAYKSLRDGGIFRVTAPNMMLDLEYLNRNDTTFWYWQSKYSKKGQWEDQYYKPLSEASIFQLFLLHVATPLSELSKIPSRIKFNDIVMRELIEKRLLKSFWIFLHQIAHSVQSFPALIFNGGLQRNV